MPGERVISWPPWEDSQGSRRYQVIPTKRDVTNGYLS